MKYTIKATYTTALTVDIDESNTTQAYLKACEMSLMDFEQVKDSGVLKVHEVTLSEANFTEEQLAFMKAYLTNVAVADKSVVKAFMLSEDDDEFYKDHSETYSGLADARGIWEDAKHFYKDGKA
jgi:hypothetical protein